MTPFDRSLLCLTAILCFIQSAVSLSCYSCVSTQPGCGQELNIRLQRWHSCPSTGTGGGENFCVKALRKHGSSETITRDCLMTMLDDTTYRTTLPTVRRHGYCSYGRNDDPWNPFNKDLMFCFCNDWNGCNGAPSLRTGRWAMTGLLAAAVSFMLRWML